MSRRLEPRFLTRALAAATLSFALLGVNACSSDSNATKADGGAKTTSSAAAPSSSDSVAKKRVLKILLSNDDGYNAPGIDALVRALTALPDVEIVVAAPATQQSGKGSTVTEGELSATEEKTLSGYPAFAVAGTPADSVDWALDGGVDMKPDLVITGINAGQNLGKVADSISGTVGAARAATARGIPALATSLASDNPDNINEVLDVSQFDNAAKYVVDWVNEHREGIFEGKYSGATPLLENLNVPLCTAGTIRGVAQVELAPTGDFAVAAQNCESTVPQPSDDITAFNNGFVTISPVPLTPAGG